MPLLETAPLMLLIWAVIGYLLGSIPFGMVLARVMGLGNLRDIGSGSIGATNVLRTGSKPAAALTLLLDALKGVAAVLIARAVAGEDAAQIAGLMAMIGHCYPVWLRFDGGKGVATYLGLMLILSWPVGVGCCLAWLIGAGIFRMSSMASLISAAASSFLVVLVGTAPIFLLSIALTLLIFWRHRSNIARLKAGTEPKIGQKS